jgi:hypothetical protein
MKSDVRNIAKQIFKLWTNSGGTNFVSCRFRLSYSCRVNNLVLAVQRLGRLFSVTAIVKLRNRSFVLSIHYFFLKIQTFRIEHNESIFVLLAVIAVVGALFRWMKTKHFYFHRQTQAWRLAAKPQRHSALITHGKRYVNKCFVPIKLPMKWRERKAKT